MTPTPDTKGAQPEQLVALLDELDHARTNGEAADIHERIGLWAEQHGRTLATALSKCQEREWKKDAHLRWCFEQLRMWWRDFPHSTRDPGADPVAAIAELDRVEGILLAAQPPSEASEGKP